jgi:hypothetical protein
MLHGSADVEEDTVVTSGDSLRRKIGDGIHCVDM